MFRCDCGERLLLPARKCGGCGARVVFDAAQQRLRPIREGEEPRLCANANEIAQCNWLSEPGARPAAAATANGNGGSRPLCRACLLTRLVPASRAKRAIAARQKFERAKKRLLVALMRLRLFPQYAFANGIHLEINLMEDSRDNPAVAEDWVPTGHSAGVITINAREADRAALELARQEFGEKYRTLLGHLRHESGHYFWHALVQPNAARLDAFRELFGDERRDYGEALRRYYALPPRRRNRPNPEFIAPYAASHPHEDWAESWAHFLHLEDALSVARDLNLIPPPQPADDFSVRLRQWLETAEIINEMCESLGLRRAYPFSPSGKAAEKMRFISELAQHLSPAPQTIIPALLKNEPPAN